MGIKRKSVKAKVQSKANTKVAKPKVAKPKANSKKVATAKVKKAVAVKPKTAKKVGTQSKPMATSKATAKTASKTLFASQASVTDLLPVGSVAPDFRLLSDSGQNVALSSLRGKTVVLYFYPKDSTPGCTVEACDFRDNLSRVTAKGAIVLGVSADSVASHQRFKEKQSLNFPLLSDPDKKVLGAYKVWQEKSLYGRKFMGIVRTTYVINGQGKIAHVFPKVKVAGHADQVLAVL